MTEINSILGSPLAAPTIVHRAPAPAPTPSPTPTPASTSPAAGWYPDPAGGPQHRYWDGERWAAAPSAPVPMAAPITPAKPAQVGTIIAFVFAAAAGVIPVLGLVGVGFGIAAMVRKEPLGRISLIVTVAITLISFVIWSAINGR